MRLSIAIPEAQMVDAPTLLRLVRMAPVCDIEAGEEGALYLAFFEDFPKSAETVARLIEEAWDLDHVRILLEERPVVSRINFYVALRCYHGSLSAPDAEAYCLQQAAKVGTDKGCPDRSCLSHCRFMCSRCVGLSSDQGAPPISSQLWELARQAEADWCPNLHLAEGHAPVVT
ncbi:MAG: hypothetical protein JNN16_19460 [Nitrospira sp.]|nr:hypothetical protein [Nitrospira sp.]